MGLSPRVRSVQLESGTDNDSRAVSQIPHRYSNRRVSQMRSRRDTASLPDRGAVTAAKGSVRSSGSFGNDSTKQLHRLWVYGARSKNFFSSRTVGEEVSKTHLRRTTPVAPESVDGK